MKTETILDSVQVPDGFVELCGNWYDGSGSMMHAIGSTGNLSRGSIRPTEDDGYWQEYPRRYVHVWREMTDLEWYRSLFSDLSSEIAHAIRRSEKSSFPDIVADCADLRSFDAWCDGVIDTIDAEIESTESEVE